MEHHIPRGVAALHDSAGAERVVAPHAASPWWQSQRDSIGAAVCSPASLAEAGVSVFFTHWVFFGVLAAAPALTPST